MDLNHRIEDRFGVSTEIGKTVEENETITRILSRGSHRIFKSDPVSQDLLDTLLATAFSAPSKSDLQQASVIHIQDQEKQQRIAHLSAKTKWIAEAPIFLVWCGDHRRIQQLANWRKHPFANDHLDSFMNAAVDAGICMQTFIIAAESVGLGCCAVSEIRDHIQSLSQELRLPPYVFPVAGLCIGWPQNPTTISMRLPLSTTVKVDVYEENNLIEEVKKYDTRREKRENTPPNQQRFVEEFGVSDNYGWSENRTRQYSHPMRENFGEYIRNQGFTLS